MKNKIFKIGAFLIILCAVINGNAQINRTLETKVADVLAQLPTNDLDHSDRLMEDVLSLKSEGIEQLCKMLVPLGSGDDTQVRYALNSLAVYAGGKENEIKNNVVENTFIEAIKKTSDAEVKTFLIQRLAVCGSSESVNYLSEVLNDVDLYRPALGTIVSIGSSQAGAIVLSAAKEVDEKAQLAFIEALGNLKYKKAVPFLESLVELNKNTVAYQKSLKAIADIAIEGSEKMLFEAAKQAEFKLDKGAAITAYIRFGERMVEQGNTAMAVKVGKSLLKYCKSDDQLHFRTAGVNLLSYDSNNDYTKTYLKEAKNANNKYRGAALETAANQLKSEDVEKWVKAYQKAEDSAKPQFVRMLQSRQEPIIYRGCISNAVLNNNDNVRIAGIKALAYQDKNKAFPLLLEVLNNAKTPDEFKAIEDTLLRICGADDVDVLVGGLNDADSKGKEVLIHVLTAKNAVSQYSEITSLLEGNDNVVDAAIYASLLKLASIENLSELLVFLEEAEGAENIKDIQQAIMKLLDSSDEDNSKIVLAAFEKSSKKIKFTPLLAGLSTKDALTLVNEVLGNGGDDAKIIALQTLNNWSNKNALPSLFNALVSEEKEELQSIAFDNYLSQISQSTYPDDQKLLLIKKLVPFSKTLERKEKILNNVRDIKTFLSLIFVAEYLDDDSLKRQASNAAIRIALPNPGKKDGLSGEVVREIMEKCVQKLSSFSGAYSRIDAQEFLDNMSSEKGFVSIFNGKDLTGWEGLVKNPIERAKMSEKELAEAQVEADKVMSDFWFVKDGVIGFDGEGYNNICTVKDYGDFEMLVDWKITNGGDSGIYLRGTPQVQIWDIARTNVGAQVGSGGLYNNKVNERIPLEVADNPIDEWNTFRIKMVGERVTVHLNGVLVTDNVILENYWDRALPIFTKEAIELQAHGEDLGFRNIYVREINSGDELLSDEEQEEGFTSLFNGKDLDHWIGNKIDYYAENNELLARPTQGGHGNMFTAEEYSDFIFRFEFKLTPGANNGLGIHAPVKGDAAYEGKEIQILDNTAAIYANLKPYQYHGSVYGIIAAKRGFLNPVGEWNSEEVYVKGNYIKVTLNGTVILEGDMKEASKNGPLDGKKHSGLKRNKGHIGFLGHGADLDFRNIRIRDLSK